MAGRMKEIEQPRRSAQTACLAGHARARRDGMQVRDNLPIPFLDLVLGGFGLDAELVVQLRFLHHGVGGDSGVDVVRRGAADLLAGGRLCCC